MRESRTYGSGRGACHEMHVPTATQPPRVHHAARRRGGGVAARGARAAAERCGASACSCTRSRTMPRCRPASPRSAGAAGDWAGRTAATCGSSTAGREGDADDSQAWRRNWSRSQPDVIVAGGGAHAALAAKARPRTVPIVFVSRAIRSAGLVASLARPGGNVTGFSIVRIRAEPRNGWSCSRDRARRHARGGPSSIRAMPTGSSQLGDVQAAAPSLGREVSPVNCATPARSSAPSRPSRASRMAALIVTASRSSMSHRDLIIALAARHTLPAVYRYATSSQPAA